MALATTSRAVTSSSSVTTPAAGPRPRPAAAPPPVAQPNQADCANKVQHLLVAGLAKLCTELANPAELNKPRHELALSALGDRFMPHATEMLEHFRQAQIKHMVKSVVVATGLERAIDARTKGKSALETGLNKPISYGELLEPDTLNSAPAMFSVPIQVKSPDKNVLLSESPEITIHARRQLGRFIAASSVINAACRELGIEAPDAAVAALAQYLKTEERQNTSATPNWISRAKQFIFQNIPHLLRPVPPKIIINPESISSRLNFLVAAVNDSLAGALEIKLRNDATRRTVENHFDPPKISPPNERVLQALRNTPAKQASEPARQEILAAIKQLRCELLNRHCTDPSAPGTSTTAGNTAKNPIDSLANILLDAGNLAIVLKAYNCEIPEAKLFLPQTSPDLPAFLQFSLLYLDSPAVKRCVTELLDCLPTDQTNGIGVAIFLAALCMPLPDIEKLALCPDAVSKIKTKLTAALEDPNSITPEDIPRPAATKTTALHLPANFWQETGENRDNWTIDNNQSSQIRLTRKRDALVIELTRRELSGDAARSFEKKLRSAEARDEVRAVLSQFKEQYGVLVSTTRPANHNRNKAQNCITIQHVAFNDTPNNTITIPSEPTAALQALNDRAVVIERYLSQLDTVLAEIEGLGASVIRNVNTSKIEVKLSAEQSFELPLWPTLAETQELATKINQAVEVRTSQEQQRLAQFIERNTGLARPILLNTSGANLFIDATTLLSLGYAQSPIDLIEDLKLLINSGFNLYITTTVMFEVTGERLSAPSGNFRREKIRQHAEGAAILSHLNDLPGGPHLLTVDAKVDATKEQPRIVSVTKPSDSSPYHHKKGDLVLVETNQDRIFFQTLGRSIGAWARSVNRPPLSEYLRTHRMIGGDAGDRSIEKAESCLTALSANSRLGDIHAKPTPLAVITDDYSWAYSSPLFKKSHIKRFATCDLIYLLAELHEQDSGDPNSLALRISNRYKSYMSRIELVHRLKTTSEAAVMHDSNVTNTRPPSLEMLRWYKALVNA